MMSAFLLFCTLTGVTGDWTTFTNTNYVNDIAGNDSVLYLATSGGLRVFTVRDTTFRDVYTNARGLPVNDLLCCVEDRAGLIWIGTAGGGLVVFDPGNGSFYDYPTDLLPLTVTSLGVSGDTILLGSENGAFVIARQDAGHNFSNDIVIQFQSPRILSNTVISVGAAGGSFWIVTDAGVSRVAQSLDSTWAYPHPFGDSARSVIDYQGSAYIATDTGVVRFNGVGFDTVAAYPQPHSVRKLAAWQDTLYVAVEDGLLRLGAGGFESVWSNDVRALLARSDLWLGFGGLADVGGGLGRISPDGADNTWLARQLASNSATAAISCGQDEIYACHYLTQWGYRTVSHLKPDQTWEWLTDTIINPVLLARDSKGRIWFGHFALNGGVSAYDPADSTWQAIQWGNSDYRNVVSGFGIDGQDTKWVFSQAGTIIAIDSIGQQQAFTVPGVARPSGGGYDFAFDSRGRAWFGCMNGIGMIDTKGTLHDPSDDSIAFITTGTNVPSVAVDRSNRVWFGTSQGAGVLDSGNLRYYNTSNSGILGDDVSRVRVDSWGNVWCLTDNGLSIFDPANQRWSQSDINRGLIPNLQQLAGFYASMDLDEADNSVLVGTLAGLGQFHYTIQAESTARNVAIYPNPFIQGVKTSIVFDSLPKKARVQVFTLSGELVADSREPATGIKVGPNAQRGSWEATWAPTRIASGLYLAVVWAGSQRSVYRFAVVNRK